MPTGREVPSSRNHRSSKFFFHYKICTVLSWFWILLKDLTIHFKLTHTCKHQKSDRTRQVFRIFKAPVYYQNHQKICCYIILPPSMQAKAEIRQLLPIGLQDSLRKVRSSVVGSLLLWSYIDPSHVCGNAAKLEYRTIRLFYRSKNFLFCSPVWLHSHRRERGLQITVLLCM